jgi:uncharacterized membrane protein (DUF4010 family)
VNELFNPAINLSGAFLRVLVAALAGGLIGVERERSQSLQHETTFGGARTFPLIAILGASLTLVNGGIGAAVVAGFAGLAALVVAAYVLTSAKEHPGVTTEIAAFATYWIGTMAGAGALVLAGAVAVGTAVLLASKERVEGFSRALTQEELSAALTLAVLAAIILPVLPDQQFGPWGVWNPHKLWLVVVLVCGLSFAAFIAMRVWGATKGLYVSGLLGGLVSSTAATVSLATRSREVPEHQYSFAVAAGLASLVMAVRVGVLTGVSNRALLLKLLVFLGVVIVAGAIPVAWLALRSRSSGKPPDMKNPFDLKTALKFGLLYAIVLLVVEAAKRQFGSWGLIVAAALAGLADVDAITLALATQGSLLPEQAAGGIALATLSNTAAKAGYASWFGRGRFRTSMLVILGAAFAAGAIALMIIGPQPWSGDS